VGKVFNFKELIDQIEKWRSDNQLIVFTNGCFDILHRGHVDYLSEAKQLGDKLIIGLNSDNSVKAVKGVDRPFVPQEDRAIILANLLSVDAVVIFEEESPFNLIHRIKPDVLVKGGDYSPADVVGRDVVEENGGKLVIIPFITGKSSSGIIQKIRSNIIQGN
jgi:D-beta-D-heptose 7-phosphate kinase/D-beta-D-heptose 1-phosphate adenosyltransferase